MAIVQDTFSQSFTNNTGFTYDNTKAEFTSGLVRQTDQRPANSIVGSTFTSTLNASFGADGFGSLVAGLNGTPSVSGGEAVCVGSNGFYYQDALIGNLSGDWVIKCKYRPQYAGIPASNSNILTLATPSVLTDIVVIFHSSIGGSLRITANGLAAQTFGPWVAVSGTEYGFEVHCVSNVVSVYVDDVQIGTGKTINPAQGTTATQLWVGAYPSVYAVADAHYSDVVLYSVAPQTSTYTVPETAYYETKVELPEFIHTELGAVDEFIGLTTTETNDPRQVWNDLYWNGAAWVASDGSFAQSNTRSDILTNIAAFPSSNTLNIDVLFANSSSQMSIDEIEIEYDYDNGFPSIVTVNGYQFDQNGDIDTSKIKVELVINDPEYSFTSQVVKNTNYITPNSTTGQWTIDIVGTDNMVSGSYYRFTFKDSISKNKTVPDSTPVNFNDLADY